MTIDNAFSSVINVKEIGQTLKSFQQKTKSRNSSDQMQTTDSSWKEYYIINIQRPDNKLVPNTTDFLEGFK
jgi:hypothetical protein